MKRMHDVKACAVALAVISVVLAVPHTFAQNQLVPVAIVNFQDDSGANASPELRLKLAQELQQKLIDGYKDLLPRMMSFDVEPGVGQSLTVDRLVALGQQNGARFVVRGGLLGAVAEPMIEKSGMKIQLYAEVISVDTGGVVATVRAEGAATQADPVPALSEVDPKSEQFRTSAAGLAIAAAMGRLAESVHEAVTTPVVAAVEQPTTTTETAQPGAEINTTQSEPAPAADVDAELQQLIAQAESILSTGTNASTQSITAVNQALQSLQSALAAKVSLMEGSQDTTRADQDVIAARDALQAAVTQATSDVALSAQTPGAPVEQPSAEKKGLLASVDEGASHALSMLQEIQQIRTALGSADESANHQVAEQSGSEAAPPAEEPVGEATGVVLDDSGNPVEGAQVTDQESGATSVTDTSGVFRLRGLLTANMAAILVQKGQSKTSSSVQIWAGRPTVVDFRLKPAVAGKTAIVGVLPSTVVLSSTAGRVPVQGVLKGVVQDAQGRAVPRALVNLKGLGVARTNSQGQYAFLNVPEGTHEVIVNQSGLKPRVAQVQVVARKTNDARIQFAASDQMPKAPGGSSLVLANSSTLVKGTVLDTEHHPVGGARVSVVREYGAVSVFTRPNGTFELRNLNPGPNQLVVSKAGYEGSSTTVTLRTAAAERRDFRLKKQNSPVVASVLANDLAQRVVIRGRVRGVNGVALSNATVELRASGASLPIMSVKTGGSGDYSFNVREGQYEVRVRQGVYRDASRTMNARTGVPVQVDFSLQPASVNIAAVPQPGVIANRTSEANLGSVSGQITDARTRRPVVGAAIVIAGFPPARTDSQGKYSLMNVAAGECQARVISSGYSEESRRIRVRSGTSTREDFALAPQSRSQTAPAGRQSRTQAVAPMFVKPGNVSGQVLDARTHRPVAGVTISITGQRSVSSDSAGRLLMANVPPGTYQVSAVKGGYSSDQRTVVVRSGETARVSFMLTLRIVAPVRPRT